jgi:methionine biosynthesis protein MetW
MFQQDAVYAEAPVAEERPPENSVPGKVLALVRPGMSVLDVGCGAGRLSRLLSARGASVTGIERDPRAAARARAHCARVIEADLAGADPLPPGDLYDAVVCADVLEHLERPDLALAALATHVRPGGLAIVSLPNVAHYEVRLRLLAGRFDYAPSGILDRSHLRFFTRRTALELIRQSGLRVLAVDAVYAVPLGRLARFWPGMPRALGSLSPRLFAAQWVLQATRDSR